MVVDETVAFVGGINYSAEHMSDYGPEAKQDYAIRIEGPVVQDIQLFVLEKLTRQRGRTPLVATPPSPGREPQARRGAGAVRLAG